ncbi:hypothetical protein Pmani_020728 [Petrolisthes manimaculis]|uniref:KANL2-like probable zinc-finger domain-containing protein n=1 Tax=Petrolisthes manimaculis TaxID=1843537 RepID=A0AAE1PF44_9EUCA|nr:hypothetical protein Pmani_020728 [Petrolisthes manimaculis]
MLTPAWTPPTISSNSVGGGGSGAGKRARGSEVVNGHHGRPRPHTHHQPSPQEASYQQSSASHSHHHPCPQQDASYQQSSTPHSQHQPCPPQDASFQHNSALPQQSPLLSPHTTLVDVPKAQVIDKRLSGTVPASSALATSQATLTNKGRERWGGWLGGTFNSQRGRSDSSKQCANSTPLQQTSELRSSGFDMTKLYPELSAKLGLTKHTPNDNTGTHKNGITVRDNFTSGSLKKLEHVTDDARIKVVSTGQILNNAKGLLTAKLGNGLQSCKSSSTVKSSKSKSKSGEKGQRRGGQSRSGGRGAESATCGSAVHTSSHSPGLTPIKGPSLLSNSGIRNNSGGNLNSVKSNNIISSSASINPSSILEEQLLRGGGTVQQRHHSNTSGSGLHHASRLGLPQPSSTTTTTTTRLSSAVTNPLVMSSSATCPGRSLVRATATTTYPPPLASQQPRVVTLPPRRPPQSALTTAATATLPHTLLRVHALREKYYAYNSDLFPLGIETSEESDGSDTDDLCGSQQGWLDPTDGSCERYQSWVNNNFDEPNGRQKLTEPTSTTLSCQRSVTLAFAVASYRRRIAASRVRTEVRAWESERQGSLTRTLVGAARSHPRLAADACCLYRTSSQTAQESPKYKSRFRSSVLRRRGCVYNDGEGKGECREPSLPGTRHCMRHIMYNVDQQLFTHCTARQPDNTLCRVPVFDVAHELPLCYNHSKTQENVVKAASEEISKPKRSRKKNKMPILSRYGKRSKKRRRSSNSSSSVIPSTSVRPPMASQASLSSPQPSPTTPQTSPHFSTASCTDSVADGEESEFEDEMEDMVGDLDVASRLLDRNLQDVLTRIPDHELTQLFDAPDGKTGIQDANISSRVEIPKNKTGEFNNAVEKEEVESEAGEDDDQSVHSATPAQSPTIAVTHITTTTTTATTTTTTTAASLPLNEDATTLSLDESTINELVAGNIPIDSIISSSFNQQELNTISQALSNIVQENNINLVGFDLNTTNSFSETGGSGPVGDVSDNSLMSQASDGVGQGDFSESGHPVSECKANLLTQRSAIVGDATLSPLK